MRTPVTAVAGGLATTVVLLLAGCHPDGVGSQGPSTGPKKVPAVVGKGLQDAQDAADAAGFHHLTSHDSAGRERHQLLDRNWKVCSQAPKAGAVVPADTKLDFGAVKLAEKCPATDLRPPPKTGRTMPDFTGKGLAAARDSLPRDASVTNKDASGKGRVILLESDWTVCTQSPAPGAAYRGQPVTFTAVKIAEHCP